MLLATAVRKQAFVLAYIDGFMVLGFGVIIALALMLLLRGAGGIGPQGAAMQQQPKMTRSR